MTTTLIRKKLFEYLKKADDKKIKAMYTLFENEIEREEFEYTDVLKTELDQRLSSYQNGGKTVSPREVKDRIKSICKSAK